MADEVPSRSHSHVTAPEAEDASGRINVAVRCRPLSESERSSGAQDICRIMDGNLVILMDPGAAASNDYLRADKSKEKRYAFDRAFGPEVGTQEVFIATTKPLIGAVMQAYSATVIAYGATGAGKTYSMIGTPQEPGVMLLTVGALFQQESSNIKAATVKCSFLEVYNENLRDLLAPEGKESFIDLREDPGKGMCVVGVFETEAESLHEVMDLLRRGNQNRTTEPTAMNVTSSRSHAVLRVTVEQKDQESDEVMLGKLSLIDLAGSERASQTDNRGVRLLEGANINRSLLALGNCINALATGCAFVPYRDSKLTRLLKDSLGGSCRTVMVANVSPCHLSYEDTLNTLKYANRAKMIRITARQNIMKPETHVSQYQRLIEDLRGEVLLLKGKLANRGAVPADPETLMAAHEAGEHWKEEVVTNLESRTQLQRSLIEVDRGLAQWYVEKERAGTTISKWEENAGGNSPTNRRTGTLSGIGRWSQPKSLEDWQEQLQQIEESIRENLETRRSIEERLRQNQSAGKELQAQLPQRVLNEDLRTFLELILRVQVLEVERLELDHIREARHAQLEERDQEIELLREQLRLRNEHLAAQRKLLSDEQLTRIPTRVSLLGSTLSEASPAQNRGPMRVMHAWAPAPKESDEITRWDSRPLREREAVSEDERDIEHGSAQIPCPELAVDWRQVEVPHAEAIRGIARMQPSLGVPGVPHVPQAPKGWREPPQLRPNPGLGKGGLPRPPLDQPTGTSVANKGMAPCPPPAARGNTCPPVRRLSPEFPAVRKHSHLSTDDPEESVSPPRPRCPPRLVAQGVAPPPRRAPHGVENKAYTPGSHRRRSQSEHSAFRMGRVGKMVVHPR